MLPCSCSFFPTHVNAKEKCVTASSPPIAVADIVAWMEDVAPPSLSEAWDNTGLLLGDPTAAVRRVQTCLTLTPECAAEAIESRAEMVIAHHPLPFKPLSKITTQTVTGRLLWQLAGAGISVYCPHTAWDSAAAGINALLAEKLSLRDCRALIPSCAATQVGLGAGRAGRLPSPVEVTALAARLIELIPESRPHGVDAGRPVARLGIACGSGGSLLQAAIDSECDLFLTGEASFHDCLHAKASRVSLILIGHFASERFAMQHLAWRLQREIPSLEVWASKAEKDPVRSFV